METLKAPGRNEGQSTTRRYVHEKPGAVPPSAKAGFTLNCRGKLLSVEKKPSGSGRREEASRVWEILLKPSNVLVYVRGNLVL